MTHSPTVPGQASGSEPLTFDEPHLAVAYEFSRRFRRNRTRQPDRRAVNPTDGVSAVAWVLINAPRLQVELTDSASGRVIERRLRKARWGIRKNCIAQSLLPLPESESQYMRRVSRLARRQVRAAEEAHLSCSRVESLEEWRILLDHFCPRIPGMPAWRDTLPEREDDHRWVARDRDGRPLAFAIVVVDREWALLEVLRSIDHPARYFLHTKIVSSLIDGPAEYLLTDSPMAFRLEHSIKEFQRILGYRVAHLSLRRRTPTRR